MTIESVTYISDFNILYPANGDVKSEGDDHIRNLKIGIKNTFPNINAAVNATDEQLNFLVGVTSLIQTQLDAKSPLASPTFTGTVTAAALTATGAVSIEGNVTLGNASTDTLTVAPNAVTWSNNPTHSGNHTFSGTTAHTGAATFASTVAITGALSANGGVTLGDASGDALTVNSNAVTWANTPTHSGNHTFSGNVTVNGNTVIGNASGDTLTIAPNAVTWSNTPTHSGNHTWSGTQAFNGGVTLGDASGDALTINSSAVTCANGLNFDSNTLVVDATNNWVGIGVAPTVVAHVKSSNELLRLETTGDVTGLGQIFQRFNDSSGNAAYLGFGGVASQFDVWNYKAGALGFGTNSTLRMLIDSSGNVGIGASPVGRFDVVGAASGAVARVRSTDSTFAAVFAQNNLSGTTISDGMSMQIASDGATAYLWLYENGALLFGTNNAERGRFDALGNFIPTLTASAPALGTNLQMVMNLTSNTNLKVSVRGTDGTTRSTNLTLS